MTLWFFMSYARDDDTKDAGQIYEFFEDLVREIEGRVQNHPDEPVGYFDQENLKAGASWPSDLAAAVRSCRIFVPILTPRYFQRPYCGREWAIFEQRIEDHREIQNLATKPPLIIPIVWRQPLDDPFPEFATDLESSFDDKDESAEIRKQLKMYAAKGLQRIFKRRKQDLAPVYDVLCRQIASRIVSNAERYRLEPIARSGLPSLKDVTPRFARGIDARRAPGEAPPSSPDRAAFAFVAGKAIEMKDHRENAELCYGAQDALDWKPFAPENDDAVALIAQDAARERDLYCDWITVDGKFVQTLEAAEKRRTAAVVVVDPWVTKLDSYRAYLEDFDKRNFVNCVVLVVWNIQCPETDAQRVELETDLRQALYRGLWKYRNEFIRDEIFDRDRLQLEIRRSLIEMREKLAIESSVPARSVASGRYQSPPLVGVSRTEDEPDAD